VSALLPARLLLDVPVVPDAPTARRWAAEELANPVYHRGPSLLSRFLDWFWSLFDGISAPSGLPPGVVAAVAVVAVALIAAVAFWVAGPVRLARRAAGSAVVLVDDTRTAAELRASAQAHADQGDWPAAVLDRFRAIVRALEERALLEERPGRTAHEAAEAGGARLPAAAAGLRRAGQLSDDVCYGSGGAGPEADAWLRELDATVARTSPTPATRPAPVGSP
jgi:hypothetical protein